MQVIINGNPHTTDAATLAELVAELADKRKLAADSLIIEHNRTIIKQNKWQQTALTEGDSIELLSFVGGG